MARFIKYQIICLTGILILIATDANSQSGKIIAENGQVVFVSDAPLEWIESANSSVESIIELESGKIAVVVLIKGFTFKKKLMKKHFNEQYLESDKYPQATFVGTIDNVSNLFSPGAYDEFPVMGEITIHGIKNELKCMARFSKEGNNLIGKTKFTINLDEYNIKVPKIFQKNISTNIELNVELLYKVEG